MQQRNPHLARPVVSLESGFCFLGKSDKARRMYAVECSVVLFGLRLFAEKLCRSFSSVSPAGAPEVKGEIWVP